MSLSDMVLMPGRDYQSICDCIREKTEDSAPLCSGQLVGEIAKVFAAGETARENHWKNRFYMTQVRGSGTSSISVDVPFRPDYVFILPTDPYALVTANSFCSIHRDFKTFARIGGGEQHTNASKTPMFNQFSNKTIESFVTFSDGRITFVPPPALDAFLWREASVYTFVAMKYVEEDMNDEALLKAYVLSLPESGGTVTLSNRRFAESGMSEEAFNAFTAEHRPKWTFVME